MRDSFQIVPYVLQALKRDGAMKSALTFSRKFIERLRGVEPQRAEDLEFDRRLGIETATAVPRWKIRDISSPNRLQSTNYVPSDEQTVLMLFRMLPIRPEEFSFIDFGSGKGKVLLLAAEFGFRKITGVEFSPSLHAIAQANVERYRTISSKECEINCVHQDAAEYPIPQEKLVIFLYGPFYEPVFRVIIERLRESLAVDDRPVYIVNFGSPLAQAVREVDFLKPLPGKAGQWIYSNKA